MPKRAGAILKALIVGMFFVCLIFAVAYTATDDRIVIHKQLAFLFMAFVNAALYAIIRIVEHIVKPKAWEKW